MNLVLQTESFSSVFPRFYEFKIELIKRELSFCMCLLFEIRIAHAHGDRDESGHLRMRTCALLFFTKKWIKK